MFNIVLRTTFLFFSLLIMLRLMGKRQIGQLQPYEFALTLIAADLATTPMSNINTPLMWGILPIYVLLGLGLILSYISLKSVKARRIICGKPRLLIYKGKITQDSLFKVRYTLNDLLEQLRSQGIFDVSQVYNAVLETNGELSVILKSQFRPAVPQDLNISPIQEELTQTLVMDGKIQKENIDKMNVTEKKLKTKIKGMGFNSEKDILLMTYDGSKIFVHGYGKDPKVAEEKCAI